MEPLRPESLVTEPEAARRLNVGVRQIRRAPLPRFRVGGWVRVRWGDVLEWIDGQRIQSRSDLERGVEPPSTTNPAHAGLPRQGASGADEKADA